MNVGEMQRKLSSWAEQDKEHRFFDLYHLLYDKDWLRLAHDYVKQNAGSLTAGCDGINVRHFDEKLEENLQQLAQEIRSGTFEPYPVRRVYIQKSKGKVRPLGIPSIRDRIVQEALRMILEPVYEADFSQSSFGFRPNRCTMDAIRCFTWCCTEQTRFFWVIEGDISSYFDTINHRKLVKILRRRIKDGKILRLIWKFLRAGVMEGKLFRETHRGTPQGGIISPLLANIYLRELDKYVEKYTGLSQLEKRRRRWHKLTNLIYIRYADDFIGICNGTKAQAETIKEELDTFLSEKLRLTLSKEKTKITHLNDGFKFLGFQIKRCLGHNGMKRKILIPKEAKVKLRNKIKAITAPGTHRDSVNSKILALNRVIGGWCRYFQYTSKANSEFSKMENFIFWRMIHWFGRKFQIKTPEIIRRFKRGNALATENYRLKPADEFPTRHYKRRYKKPNPYTMQSVIVREEIHQETNWLGTEARPGVADLRPIIFERDAYICQICEKPVTADTAELDHIRPVRRFKRPVDANSLENLWTLCIDCHLAKTKSDRQMESRMQ